MNPGRHHIADREYDRAGKLFDDRELTAASLTRYEVAFNLVDPAGAAEAVELKRIL